MNHVTMLVECVQVGARMDSWKNTVIAVRNLHHHFYLTIYTLNCFIIHYTFLWIIACRTGNYGKNCKFHCSSNCNSTCENIDESCKDCQEGWSRHCSKGNYKWPTEICFSKCLSQSNCKSLTLYLKIFILHICFHLKYLLWIPGTLLFYIVFTSH